MPYLTPSTWGSFQLNSASWLCRFAPNDIEGITEVTSRTHRVMGGYPAHGGVDLGARTFGLWFFIQDGATSVRRDELASWFAPELGRRLLVAVDESSASRQITCQPLEVRPHPEHPKGLIVIMEAHNPIWESVSEKSVSASISACGQSFTPTVGGNFFTRPVISITPNTQKSNTAVQRGERPFTIENAVKWPLVKYPVDVVNGWDTTTLISSGCMRADGADIRVYYKGSSVDRWVDSINTASTRVWIVANMTSEEVAAGKVIFGASGLGTPSVNSNLEPIFDHVNSTNSKWVYTRFGDEAGIRPAGWKRFWDGYPQSAGFYDWKWISQTAGSATGTDADWDVADPWSILGTRVFLEGGDRGVYSNGYVLGLQVGASSISVAGTRRLFSGNRGRLMGQQRSASIGSAPWKVFFNDGVSTGSAWESFSRTDVFSSSARQILYKATTSYVGASTLTPSDYGWMITGASVGLTNHPIVSTSPEGNMYHLTGSLLNDTTVENIEFDVVVPIGNTIEVDTEERTIADLTTGSRYDSAITLDVLRRDWLRLANGSNVLTYSEVGVSSLDIAIVWRDRWV